MNADCPTFDQQCGILEFVAVYPAQCIVITVLSLDGLERHSGIRLFIHLKMNLGKLSKTLDAGI